MKNELKYDKMICILKYLMSFCLPVLFLCIFLSLTDIYPFGDISITRDDLYYQYIDFFAYFKDVLSGNIGFEQTFSQSLGSSPIALIGYYLFSPLNLFVVFFQKSQLELFVFIITAIKIGLCGLFFSLFISKRFSLSFGQVQILAVAYSFTQYMVGQMSNIMWLDGVYMLPLLLLGVYRFVASDKKGMLLFTVTLTVVFNWYTGYMNCIFIVLYYLYEMFVSDRIKPERDSLKKCAGKTVMFLCTEATGVLLSCAVFVPVVMGQSKGRTFDEGVLNFGTNGNFIDIFRGFLIGSNVPGWNITLFCSVLVLLAFFAYWFCNTIKLKNKLASAMLVGFMTLSMFFRPLECVWVGFKFESSYVYRFAYIAIFTVIFTAAAMMSEIKHTERQHRKRILVYSALVFTGILLFCDAIEPFDSKRLWLQIVLIVIYVAVFFAADFIKSDNQLISGARIKRFLCIVLSAFLAVLFSCEIVLNSRAVAGDDYKFSHSAYADYVTAQELLTERISLFDNTVYRMEQTSNRDNSIVVSNEALAYGYHGIQTYTSSYDENTALLLRNLGYHIRVYPSVYLDANLPADSFLGIKYLMSEDDCAGYKKTDIEGANGKNVYLNPYALPLMFSVKGETKSADNFENAFDYVNHIYSSILGRNVNVFEKAETSYSENNDGSGVDFVLSGNTGEKLLYCSFDNKTMKKSEISLNGKKCIDYSNGAWGMWENIRFIAEISDEKNIVSVKNPGAEKDEVIAYFYVLDLGKFKKITEEIKTGGAKINVFEDGNVEADYTADSDGNLLITVPFDTSWRITVNGREAEAQMWADSLISIPVQKGENSIKMTYSAAGILPGTVISLLVLLLIIVVYIFNKRKCTDIKKIFKK